jgi:hypothetical protein
VRSPPARLRKAANHEKPGSNVRSNVRAIIPSFQLIDGGVDADLEAVRGDVT